VAIKPLVWVRRGHCCVWASPAWVQQHTSRSLPHILICAHIWRDNASRVDSGLRPAVLTAVPPPHCPLRTHTAHYTLPTYPHTLFETRANARLAPSAVASTPHTVWRGRRRAAGQRRRTLSATVGMTSTCFASAAGLAHLCLPSLALPACPPRLIPALARRAAPPGRYHFLPAATCAGHHSAGQAGAEGSRKGGRHGLLACCHSAFCLPLPTGPSTTLLPSTMVWFCCAPHFLGSACKPPPHTWVHHSTLPPSHAFFALVPCTQRHLQDRVSARSHPRLRAGFAHYTALVPYLLA